MSNNKMDKQITGNFQSETMDFDQAQMWSTIESQLNKKKWRIVPFLFLGLITLVFGTWFILDHNSSLDSVSSRAARVTSTSQITQENETHIDLVQKQQISTTHQSPLVKNQKISGPAFDKKNNDNQTFQHTYPSFSLKKNRQNNHNSKLQLPADEKTNLSKVKETSNIKSLNNDQQRREFNQQISQPPLISHSNPFSNLSKKAINKNVPPQQIELTNQSTNRSPVGKSTLLTPKVELQSLSSLEHNKILRTPNLTYPFLQKDWSRCEVNPPWGLLIETYAGPNLPIQSISAYGDGVGSSSYLTDWKESQSTAIGMQAGLQVIVQHPSGFEFGGGIEYQRVVQKLKSDVTRIEVIRIFDPMAFFYIDPRGVKVYVGDTITTTQITHTTKTNEQLHQLWNLPLRIGYMTQIQNWNLGAHLGAVIHLSHSFDGTILTSSGGFVKLNSSNQELVYKKNLGVSFSADLHLGRQLGDHLEVFIRPEFRYQPKAWTTTTHLLKSKIQLSQVSVGIRYRFGK